MTRRVVVTGAAGFIGRHVVRELVAQGVEVAGLLRTPLAAAERDALGLAAWSDGGITPATLGDVAGDADTIIHCAGSGSVALSLEQPRRDFDSNVLTTQTVLEFARLRGSTRVVLASSAGVYGCATDLPIRTDAPCNPISPYGVNKKISELLAGQYARHFGVKVAIVRLFSVYGAGLRKQLLWDACRKIDRGESLFFGTGSETRDWIHVADAARLMIRAGTIAQADTPAVLNGGTGRAVAIGEILGQLAALCGFEGRVGFSGEVRAGDPQHYQAEITSALATGWTPQVDLMAGLADYVRWFRAVSAAEPPAMLRE